MMKRVSLSGYVSAQLAGFLKPFADCLPEGHKSAVKDLIFLIAASASIMISSGRSFSPVSFSGPLHFSHVWPDASGRRSTSSFLKSMLRTCARTPLSSVTESTPRSVSSSCSTTRPAGSIAMPWF